MPVGCHGQIEQVVRVVIPHKTSGGNSPTDHEPWDLEWQRKINDYNIQAKN